MDGAQENGMEMDKQHDELYRDVVDMGPTAIKLGLKMEPAGIGWGGIGAGAVGGCGDGNGAYMDECGDGDGAYMEGHA
ncbi:uncharacterized [Tachysurus ichikawai]